MFALLLASLFACDRQNPAILATADGIKVTVEEFRFRRSFTPYIFHSKTLASQNREFCASLIGEKWMAQQARTYGLAGGARYRAQMAQLQREFLYEALYKDQVAGRPDPDQALNQLLRATMAGKSMRIGHESFAALEQALSHVLDEIPFLKDSTRTLTEQEANLFYKTYGDLPNRILVRFNSQAKWTVADLLERLSVGPYPLPSPHSANFGNALKQVIKRAAELEFISQKARELGLAKRADVTRQEQMWSDALLAQSLMQYLQEQIQISEEEVRQYYQNHLSNLSLNPRSVPLDSVQQQIRRQLRSERVEDLYRGQLSSLPKKIYYNMSLLDTLVKNPSADLVVKRHFPGRLLAPIVFPFAEFMGTLPELAVSEQTH